jgi:beta-galactosidase GanA
VPEIKETKGVKQLYVNNEPYLILGGELLNSSASSIEHMEDIWEHVRSLNVNTVYLPITWQQFEPQEGTIDYSLIDSHIKNAYDNDLKLIILWFGSWKNGESHYTPDWVKKDMERFPRMLFKSGKISTTISNINRNCLDADMKAYKKLMERIAQVDKHGTVLMMQIENEVGLLGGTRDFSPEATKLFEQQVPSELITYIGNNLNKLKPNIYEPYVKNGSKTQGTWEEVFGKSPTTDEIFMAWNYAKYVNEIAKAGKIIHGLPTFVNAWDASGGNLIPGVWPRGGANYLMVEPALFGWMIY